MSFNVLMKIIKCRENLNQGIFGFSNKLLLDLEDHLLQTFSTERLITPDSLECKFSF